VFSIKLVVLRLRFRLSVWIVATFFLVWVLLLVVSPLSVPAGSLVNLDGIVGVDDHGSLFSSLPQPWQSVYAIGDRLCHQMEDRSFILGGNEMAFCARCTGVWIGMLIGLVLMAFVEIPLDNRLAWAVVVGLVPMAVDGGGQFLGWWESVNPIRFVTGLSAGLVGGIAIGIIVLEIGGLVWRKRVSRS
jgi:uncharacterized membrane protein